MTQQGSVGLAETFVRVFPNYLLWKNLNESLSNLTEQGRSNGEAEWFPGFFSQLSVMVRWSQRRKAGPRGHSPSALAPLSTLVLGDNCLLTHSLHTCHFLFLERGPSGASPMTGFLQQTRELAHILISEVGQVTAMSQESQDRRQQPSAHSPVSLRTPGPFLGRRWSLTPAPGMEASRGGPAGG